MTAVAAAMTMMMANQARLLKGLSSDSGMKLLSEKNSD
jgi:hypothetical protein